MINLRCASRVERDDIKQIIEEKYNPGKAKLLVLKTRILSRYSDYVNLESNRKINSTAFSEDEKNILVSMYSSKTKTAKAITGDILAMLNQNHSDCCLYCGIGEIDQLDHFLPQEHFPEFCILHKNLIPCCGTCNDIKGANIPGQNGNDYLHLIYNIIPLESIFCCNVSFLNQTPVISFSILPEHTGSLLYTHFDRLKLKERMEKKAIQYSLQIKALKEEFGIDYAQEELSRDYRKSNAFFGSFYWKTELIGELINVNFLDNIS